LDMLPLVNRLLSPACRWKKDSGWRVHSFLSIVVFPVPISCGFHALIYTWFSFYLYPGEPS
jgi:hypothetical protein